jgi:8-oxo-dGTP diphosphatase
VTGAHAAVAIVVARRPDPSVLLLRRRESETDHWSGHWCFPGGRRHADDADLLETALRELREECGLSPARSDVSRELPVSRAGSRHRYLLVQPYVIDVEEPLPIVLHELEMVEWRWLPLQELRDPARHSVRAVPGQPPDRLVAAFEMEPVPLWGFTLRLACEVAGASPATATP